MAIRFYETGLNPSYKLLPDICVKAIANGHRILLLLPQTSLLSEVDSYLWTYDSTAILPHTLDANDELLEYKIFLSADMSLAPKDFAADMLIVLDQLVTLENAPEFADVCYIVASNSSNLAEIKKYAQTLKTQKDGVNYYRQDSSLKWQKVF